MNESTAQQMRDEFLAALQQADTLQKLEQVRIEFLSRNGRISLLFDTLKTAPPEQKPQLGKLFNELRKFAQEQFDARKQELEKKTWLAHLMQFE